MANRIKELEEQLTVLKRENSALKIRLEQAQKDISEFEKRENVITETMAAAVQYKKDAEGEAERIIASMTQNAEKSAKATMENAQNEADRIVSVAHARADVIIEEANKKAREIVEQTEVHTKEAFRIARREADKTNEHTAAVNTALISAATELFGYISAYKAIYEKVAGKSFGTLPSLPITDCSGIETPDSYDNPADLYHVMMALEGRQRAGAAQDVIPDSVPMTDEMLDLPDTSDAVAEVLDLEHAGDASADVTPAENVNENAEDGQQESQSEDAPAEIRDMPADEATADETPADAKSEEEAAADNGTDEEDLESMLTCFMNDLGEDDNPPANDFSGAAVQPSDAENLRDVLSSLLEVDDNGKGIEG